MRRAVQVLVAVVLWVRTPCSAQGSPLFRLGTGEGASDEIFTHLSAVVIDSHQRVIVLDGGEHHLVVFSRDGRRSQYLGRLGGGPGEFQAPSAMTITGSGLIVVVDPAASRLTVFDASQADSVRYQGSWAIPVRGTELCAAGSRLFVLADGGQQMIHEFRVDRAGASIVRSFATPLSRRPSGSDPRVRMLTAQGPLACSPGGDRIAFASLQLGELRVFDGAGKELLYSMLIPFRSIGLALDGPRVTYVWPKEGFVNQVVALLVNDNGEVVVNSVAVQRGPDGSRTGDYEFRTLGPLGAVVNTSPAHSRLVAVSSSRMACVRDDPAPELLVYERTGAGGRLCP